MIQFNEIKFLILILAIHKTNKVRLIIINLENKI